jgi:hypothetical protein
MGCEVEALTAGQEVTIVGFGSDRGWFEGGAGPYWTEKGTKREAPQIIESIQSAKNEAWIVGDNAGACAGDSGGPVLVRMADGTWRVFGVTSYLHPDSPYDDQICDWGAVYPMVTAAVPFIEQSTGLDVTPCNDADGTWNPGPDCGDFPLEPGAGGGSWADGCATDVVGGGEQVCAAWGADDPGGDDGGDTDTDDGSETGPDPDTEGDGDGEDDDGQTTETGDGGSGADSDWFPAGGDERSDEGCGCVVGSSPPVWAGLGLLGMTLWRRPRRRGSLRG